MRIKHILAASAAALCIGIASPAAAQDSVNEAGPGSADDNIIVTDGLDLMSNNSGENGNNRENDDNIVGSNVAGDDLNQGNSHADDSYNDASADGSVNNDDGNLINGSNVAGDDLTQGSDLSDNSSHHNGNSEMRVTATQVLLAVTTDNPVSWNEDERGSVGGYGSGDMSVNGNSFSAFAGINNMAWNTGIASNAQAATNVAAQGTVNFGDGD